MPRYAQFDPRQPDPKMVVGWYDTDEFNYPNLPDATHLIEMTDAQWNLHLTASPDGWAIINGKLTAPARKGS
ncbi:hypothetical protein [Burkholderia multivorans]|uniref:hypothetical protein n=1 Tax=Burkholderia multivorans TaxID=87883 RepID=UPI0011B258B0|nr:hypothetical protein [Burkholderia multivorans]